MSISTQGHTGPAASPQHPTHRRLLHRPPQPSAGTATVDAVIVPAARHASQLKPAAWLAANLGAPLVVLCSHDASAAEVRASWSEDATVVAVDLRGRLRLPKLLTTATIGRTEFARKADTAAKRNVGLAVARMMAWERVLFLDDDIEGVEPEPIQRAAVLLDDFEVVGLDNVGFPDNSVVCHANRDTGAFQSTFIGGGAMLFRGTRAHSMFPDIYNEDWFFVLDGESISRCAIDGRFSQKPFDPYKNPGRAGSEEFGDCLAEGIFALLDAGLAIRDADHTFWVEFLASRSELIDGILDRLPGTSISQFRQGQISASLHAAAASLQTITPELCTWYLKAWRHDLDRWRDWVGRLPQGLSIEDALAHLGLYQR